MCLSSVPIDKVKKTKKKTTVSIQASALNSVIIPTGFDDLDDFYKLASRLLYYFNEKVLGYNFREVKLWQNQQHQQDLHST